MRQRRPSLPNMQLSRQDEEEESNDDPDAITNNLLDGEKKTISRLKIKTLRLVSVITGAQAAGRRKIFYEIQSNADMKIWTVTVHGATVTCAKFFNPAKLFNLTADDFARIKNVQRLEIEDPEGILTSLPKSVASSMTKLRSFSITWARIKSLPTIIYHSNLKSLNLRRNHIKTLNGIEKASGLQILNLGYNYISALPKNIGCLINLTDLNLSANCLQELPESLCLLKNLKSLDCSCNRLHSLPQNIGHLTRLSTLDISTNQLNTLPRSIGNLPELIDLRISSNHLTELPITFYQLSRLNSLVLRKNKFCKVPQELYELVNLQHLNMKANDLSEFDVYISPLRHLNLDGNLIVHVDPVILQMENLQTLSLQDNKIVSIPDDIGKLKSLKTLYLSNNPISVVPNAIKNLSKLKHLSLKKTLISELPIVICNMSYLVHINLDECSGLEAFLKIAYKNNGLEGVRNHMRENNDIKQDETDSKQIVKRTLTIERSNPNVKTMLPDGLIRGAKEETKQISKENDSDQVIELNKNKTSEDHSNSINNNTMNVHGLGEEEIPLKRAPIVERSSSDVISRFPPPPQHVIRQLSILDAINETPETDISINAVRRNPVSPNLERMSMATAISKPTRPPKPKCVDQSLGDSQSTFVVRERSDKRDSILPGKSDNQNLSEKQIEQFKNLCKNANK